MLLKYVLTLLLAFLIGADPKVIHLGEAYTLQNVDSGWQPPKDSQVTYVIDGIEFRPDHKTYNHATGEPLGRTWFMITDYVIDKHQYLEGLAIQHNSPLVVYVNSEDVILVDFPQANQKVEISSPGFLEQFGKGALVSPDKNAPTFTLGQTEFHPDGKVYVQGKPTGETWGIPSEAIMASNGTEGGPLSGLNGIVSDIMDAASANGFGQHTIVAVEKYIDDKKAWDSYVKHKGNQVQADFQKAIDSDKIQTEKAKQLAEQISLNGQKAKEDFSSWAAGSSGYFNTPPPNLVTTPNSGISDLNDSEVKFEISDKVYSSVKNQIKSALKAKNFEKLADLVDVVANSNQKMPTNLKAVTLEGRLLLPEKVDPSLSPAPLSNISMHWKQNSHLGQVATRTANRLQAQWGIQNGFKGASSEKVVNYMLTVGIYRKGIEIMPSRPVDSYAALRLANFMLDTTAGLTVGVGQGIKNLVLEVPELIAFTGKSIGFAAYAIDNPAWGFEKINEFIDAIPEIRHHIYRELNKNLNHLTGKSDYERARVIGRVVFDVIEAFTSAGSTAVKNMATTTIKTVPDTFKIAKDTALGIKKSGKFLDEMMKVDAKIQHLSEHATNIQFHSPGTSANPFKGKDAYIADTFSGGNFMSYDVKKPMTLYRVYSDDKFQRGRFFTDIPTKGTSAMVDLALTKSTQNIATKWAIYEIPVGIKVFDGNAATMQLLDHNGTKYMSPESFLGGGRQYFINRDDLEKLKLIKYGDI